MLLASPFIEAMAASPIRKMSRPYSTRSCPSLSFNRRSETRPRVPRMKEGNAPLPLPIEIPFPFDRSQFPRGGPPIHQHRLAGAGQAGRSAVEHRANAACQAFHRGDGSQRNQEQKQTIFHQVLSFLILPKPIQNALHICTPSLSIVVVRTCENLTLFWIVSHNWHGLKVESLPDDRPHPHPLRHNGKLRQSYRTRTKSDPQEPCQPFHPTA